MRGMTRKFRRSMTALALGGSSFALFGTGAVGGCTNLLFADIQQFYASSGVAAIQETSNALFGTLPANIQDILVTPFTNLVIGNYTNFVAKNVPIDTPYPATILE